MAPTYTPLYDKNSFVKDDIRICCPAQNKLKLIQLGVTN